MSAFIEFLRQPFEVGNLRFTPLSILVGLALVGGLALGTAALKRVLRDRVLPRAGLNRGVSIAIATLISYGVMLLGVLIIMPVMIPNRAIGCDITRPRESRSYITVSPIRDMAGDAHFAELRALAVDRITRPDRYFLLVETGDEVLDYRQAVAHYSGSRQIVLPGGDHSFTRFPDFLSQIIEFCGL